MLPAPNMHAAATRVGYAQPQSPFQSFLPTSSISISSSSHRPHTPPPSQPSVEPQAQLPSHFFVQLADFIMPQIAQLIETRNSRVTGEVRETLLGIQANMDDCSKTARQAQRAAEEAQAAVLQFSAASAFDQQQHLWAVASEMDRPARAAKRGVCFSLVRQICRTKEKQLSLLL